MTVTAGSVDADVSNTITSTQSGDWVLVDRSGTANRITAANFKGVGTEVQAQNANLSSLAGLTLAANKGLYSTGANTLALFDLTAVGRTFLNQATTNDQRVALGLGGAAIRSAEDTLTDGSNLPDGAAVKAYVDGTLSTSDQGYQVFPGGLILQWGSDSVAANTTSNFGLPTTFPSAAWQAVATPATTSTSAVNSQSVAVTNITTTQISLTNSAEGTVTIRWFAVGN